MIVYGGIPASAHMARPWADRDEWTNGIGIFDLTELEWSDEFRADADQYETPKMVMDWYKNGQVTHHEMSRLGRQLTGIQEHGECRMEEGRREGALQ